MRTTSFLSCMALASFLSLQAGTSAVAEEEVDPVDRAVEVIEAGGGKVRPIAESVTWREVSFHLCPTPITDETLAQLQQIPDLRWLYLQGTSITDDQLKYLSPLTSLLRLHLEKTNVGDAGLKHLLPLRELEYLNLYGTQVSDEALPTLQQLTSLKQLYLWQSQLSEGGIEQLRQRMPTCSVVGAVELSPPTPDEGAPPPTTNQRPAFVTGRFVRISLPGEHRILQLAEVEIYQADTGQVLQTAGVASQSSTAYGAPAARAADGNPTATFSDGSVSHTSDESDPWWEIDLQEMKPIGMIRIWNRGDCCGERLQGAAVSVLDNARHEVYSTTLTDAATGSSHALPVE